MTTLLATIQGKIGKLLAKYKVENSNFRIYRFKNLIILELASENSQINLKNISFQPA
jgi:hypothetical protein